MSKLICFGEVLVDFIESDSKEIDSKESTNTYAGGAPANVAVGFAKLGGKSLLLGGIGGDQYADFLMEQLKKHKVDIRSLTSFPNAKTAKAVVSLDQKNERSFQIYRDDTADTLITADNLNQSVFSKNNMFHFCSNTLTSSSLFSTTSKALQLATTNDLLVSFDVNIRLDLWGDVALIKPRISQLFEYCDIVKMSKDELEFLSKQSDKEVKDYIDYCLNKGVNLLLVTDGENPIIGYSKNLHESVISPSVSVADTTAAGDSFISGFLWKFSQLLKNGNKDKLASFTANELKNCMQFAAICGAITCSEKGAFDAMPTQEKINNFNRDLAF